jgi:hypothetical protein
VSQPITKSGGWSSYHRLYREAAHETAAAVDKVFASLPPIWKSIIQTPTPRTRLLREYSDQLQRLIVLAATTKIQCAMSIEAFLNFYGVFHLGERVYYSKYQKQPMRKKLVGLVHDCDGLAIRDGDKLLALLLAIADARNELVHPKAREVSVGSAKPATWPADLRKEVRESVSQMEEFFEHFSRISAGARQAIDFFNPVFSKL